MVNKQPDRSRERAREDYLKALYHLGEGKPVRAVELSRQLRVSRASVSKLRRVLERDGWIATARHRADALQLTPKGLAAAVRMVRRHRLVETFLHRSLAVPLDRVHLDAEKIEHTISDDIARRLAVFLGNPTADPHGHRIPQSSAKRSAAAGLPLADIEAGRSIKVSAIDDDDDKVTRKLVALGVLPGLRATVDAHTSQAVVLRTRRRRISLSLTAAAGVRCEAL
jgi:DtxR family Mn-dependent transcriptional regulator